MTLEELQEQLRDWSARKMGWNDCSICNLPGCQWWVRFFTNDAFPDGAYEHVIHKTKWLPDRPESGQIWMVLKVIAKEIFSVRYKFTKNLEGIIADKLPDLPDGAWVTGLWNLFYMEPIDILKAYKATEET